jgi:hypothetical protein
MTVSLVDTPIRNLPNATMSHQTGAMGAVAAHETLGAYWVDRTGGLVVSGVTDDSTLPYTERSTLTIGTSDTKFYLREDVAADAALANITVTTTGSGNSQIIGVQFVSSLGGTVFPYFHAASTPNRGEPTDGVNDVTHTSNAVTVLANTALVVCAFSVGNAQLTLPTARLLQNGVDVGAATVTPAAGAGVRSFLVHANVTQPDTYSFVVTVPTSAQSSMHVIALTDETAGPLISTVDTDNSVSLEQKNFAIVGTNFSTATVEVRQDGFVYSLNIDSQNATTIQADLPTIATSGTTSAPHAGAAILAVINSGGAEDTQAITITDEASTETFSVGTPNANPLIRLTASPDYAAGDYGRISGIVGGTVSEIDINSDLTWDAIEDITEFYHQPWSLADGTWGSRALQSTESAPLDPPVPGKIAARIGFSRRFLHP